MTKPWWKDLDKIPIIGVDLYRPRCSCHGIEKVKNGFRKNGKQKWECQKKRRVTGSKYDNSIRGYWRRRERLNNRKRVKYDGLLHKLAKEREQVERYFAGNC